MSTAITMPATADPAAALRELLQAQLRLLGAQTLSPDLKQVMAELAELATPEGIEAARDSALIAAVAGPPAVKPAATTVQIKVAPVPPLLNEPSVMEIQRVGASQTQAIRSAMTRPLTLAEAPPGTAKMITLLNLIATAVMAGEKVLYAGPDSESLKAVTAQVAAVVGEKLEFVMQIGSARDFDESRDRVLSSIQAFSELEPPASNDKGGGGKDKEGKSQTREKPTPKTLVECDEIFTSEYKIIDQIRAAHVGELRQRHKLAAQPAAAGGPSLLQQKGVKAALPAAELKKWRDEALALATTPPDAARAAEALPRLSQALRVVADKLPPELKTELLQIAAKDKSFGGLAVAFDRLLRWNSPTHALPPASSGVFGRLPERKAQVLKLNGAVAKKTVASREMIRDAWLARITRDGPMLLTQAKAFFAALETWRAMEPGPRQSAFGEKLVMAIAKIGESMPLWAVPTRAGKPTLPLRPALFDLVIIDRAEMVDVASALALMFRAKRALVIGEPARPGKAADGTAIPSLPAPAMQSTAEFIAQALGRAGSGPILFTDHFRCHPYICDFIGRVFYEGKIVNQMKFDELRKAFAPNYMGVHWIKAPGSLSQGTDGLVNLGELQAVVGILRTWTDQGLFNQVPRPRVGIVAPFANQTNLFNRKAREQPWLRNALQHLIIGPPATFRDASVDILLLTPMVTQGVPADMIKLIAHNGYLFNHVVATARAGVHVVGDQPACLAAGGFLAELARATGKAEAMVMAGGAALPGDFDQLFGGGGEQSQADPAGRLAELLDDAGLCFQRDFLEGKHKLTFRVFSPLGRLYDLEIDAPPDDPGELANPHVKIQRDEALIERDYVIIRFNPKDVLDRSRAFQERFDRII
jgi:hypothetical protein